MSEEKRKQYLVLADEMHMALLGKLMPGILFIEVEGLAMPHDPTRMLLVNPVNAPAATPPTDSLNADTPRVE